MDYGSTIHHRKTFRLQEYDYSSNGMYYVTICTQDKVNLFGEIVNAEMKLNDAGRMVEKWYYELANKFNIDLDQYVIMPNHIHFVYAVGAALCVCPKNEGYQMGNEGGHAGLLLPKIVQWFKTMTTNEQELHEIRGYIRYNPSK